MKALSVKPVWGGLIRDGIKTLEIRSRATHYRGPLLICSSKAPRYGNVPCGMALCTVRVVGCRPMTPADEAAAGVGHIPGAFAWELAEVEAIEPFPIKGALGFYNVPDDTVTEARRLRRLRA